MRSSWCWLVASGLLLGTPAGGARILRSVVEHRVLADGNVVESRQLEVRMEATADLEDWSSYGILLDENRRLEEVSGTVTGADGRAVIVRSRHQDRHEVARSGELHGSAVVHRIALPALAIGSVVRLRYRVVVAPYFPSGSIALADDDPIDRLEVEVSAAPPGLRWILEEANGLELEPSETGIRLVATGLPETAAADPLPRLRYAWGDRRSWRDVGRWYQEILDGVAADDAVRQRARALASAGATPRQRLEGALQAVRDEVRYVAVEVGIGGYRPSSPGEVLARRWGDCKDQSLLLIELLAELGIDAYPALIRSSYRNDVNRDFPAADGFNHLIVAVAAAGVAVEAEDPVAGGYLFVDPTQPRGGVRWLHPAVQGKAALVVRDERSALVETPDRSESEETGLEVDLELRADGSATGSAELTTVGGRAVAWKQRFESRDGEREIRAVFDHYLPRVELDAIGWVYDEQPLPTVRLRSEVGWRELVRGLDRARAMRLPGTPVTPSPRDLEAGVPRNRAGVHLSTWRIAIPPGWCPPRLRGLEIDNGAGAFRLSQRLEGRRLLIERRVRLAPSGDGGEELRGLSVAEHRELKRSLRFACP